MQGSTRIWRADESNPVKKYLIEYRALIQRRDALLDELDRLREASVRATGHISAVPPSGSFNPSAREDAVIRVIDAETRLNDVIEHIGEALAARLALIERLEDERHKTLITLRYINGWAWERIGYEMHYERTQVFEIHGQAIKEAQHVMEAMLSAQ